MANCYVIGGTGLIIGFAFFLCFLYQWSQRKKLQNFSRSQAWYLYKKANRLLITIQNADKLYHENGKNTIEMEMVKQLAKSEAFGLEILDETLRHIHIFEPNLNSKKLKQWEEENKLLNDDKHLFEIKENRYLFEKISRKENRSEEQPIIDNS